jgi:uncharacterized membrane protein YfhO
VPSLIGNNVIYNSLNKNLRTIYAVTSRDSDQIDLNFADGVFGDLPKGNFRLFYRQSNGLSYAIKPEQMGGVVIEVPYTNSVGQTHTLQLTMSLQYTVTNAAGPESNASIQLVQNKNDEITYKAKTNAKQLAVFSEIYYKDGWKAYIDDKETPIVKVNYVLRGLAIPAGDHTIKFEFKPASITSARQIAGIASILLWLSLVTMIALAIKNLNKKENTAK